MSQDSTPTPPVEESSIQTDVNERERDQELIEDKESWTMTTSTVLEQLEIAPPTEASEVDSVTSNTEGKQ